MNDRKCLLFQGLNFSVSLIINNLKVLLVCCAISCGICYIKVLGYYLLVSYFLGVRGDGFVLFCDNANIVDR